jgi:hypothetical protein
MSKIPRALRRPEREIYHREKVRNREELVQQFIDWLAQSALYTLERASRIGSANLRIKSQGAMLPVHTVLR